LHNPTHKPRNTGTDGGNYVTSFGEVIKIMNYL